MHSRRDGFGSLPAEKLTGIADIKYDRIFAGPGNAQVTVKSPHFWRIPPTNRAGLHRGSLGTSRWRRACNRAPLCLPGFCDVTLMSGCFFIHSNQRALRPPCRLLECGMERVLLGSSPQSLACQSELGARLGKKLHITSCGTRGYYCLSPPGLLRIPLQPSETVLATRVRGLIIR